MAVPDTCPVMVSVSTSFSEIPQLPEQVHFFAAQFFGNVNVQLNIHIP
jgi:hypothetical protein